MWSFYPGNCINQSFFHNAVERKDAGIVSLRQVFPTQPWRADAKKSVEELLGPATRYRRTRLQARGSCPLSI